MFELAEELEQVKIGITAATKIAKAHFVEADFYLAIDSLSESAISKARLDLLLVSGASPAKKLSIKQVCDEHDCTAAFFDNISNEHEHEPIWNVKTNLKAKLYSQEMPNNLDIADVRLLTDASEVLLAFNCHKTLFSYLQRSAIETVVGCIYLAHGNITVDDYTQVNRKIANMLAPSASFISSILFDGVGECTAIVAIKKIQ